MKRDNQRTCRLMAVKFIFVLLLIIGFATAGFGQTTDTEENPAVQVPDRAMEQVVRKILIWSFKPRSKPTEIYLFKNGIKSAWLPKIKNIKFQLLSEEQVRQKSSGVYFFKVSDFSDGKYRIEFGFGNPFCDALGNGWNFRIINQKVKLWQYGKFGMGCSADYGPQN
jgi:hypothetical protein